MTAGDLAVLSRTAPVIKVSGAGLPSAVLDNLVQARVELGLGIIGRVTLRFTDPNHAIATGSTFALGTKIEITIATTKVITAYVTGATFSQTGESHPQFVVTADDAAYKLTRTVTPTAYEMMTYSDVFTKLANECGLRSTIASTTEQQLHQLVAGTALGYIDAVTRRLGQVWYVNADGSLITKEITGITDEAQVTAEELNSLSIRQSALRPTDVSVAGWDPKTKQAVTGQAGGSRNGTFSDGAMASYGQTGKLPTAASKISGANPVSRDEATLVSKALYTEAVDSSRVARGEARANERYVPGSKLTITGSNAFSGQFLLSEVEHIYRPGADFITRFVAGPHRPAGLIEALGNPAPDPGLNQTELLIGIVTNNADPDSLGRVKVKLPGFPGEPESGWARLATIGAGADRGIMFLPEVNDEVLVGFEGGDVRRPIVLGGLFNGTDKPPADAAAQNNGKVESRRLVSRLGNFIELSDGTGDTTNHVKVALKSGATLRVGKDETTLDTNSTPLKITVGQASVEIDKGGNVTIKGTSIALKATEDVTIEGMNVTLKATAKAALSGAAGEFKATGQLDLEGTAVTMLKGGMVMIN